MTPLRLVAALLFAGLAAPAAAAPLHAVCALERPLIGYGEHVVVTALADAPAGTPLQVTWSANGGVLSQGSGPASAVWAPTDKAVAVFTIQARVAASGETADCITRIAVTDRLTRGGDETLFSTRSLLAPDAQEAAGYGLYSYILFAAPQTDHDRNLIESILKSYLTLRDSATLETGYPDIFRRPLLNITYVPIAASLPDDFDQRNGKDKVAWIRNRYDYDRAFAFLTRLRMLPGADTAMLGGTAWIISCLQPFSGKEDPRPLLSENLTSYPLRVIPPVMRRFAEQTTQPRDYNPYAVARLSLDLRIAIAEAADGLQAVTASFRVLGGVGGEE
jgi:hypothetical protein